MRRKNSEGVELLVASKGTSSLSPSPLLLLLIFPCSLIDFALQLHYLDAWNRLLEVQLRGILYVRGDGVQKWIRNEYTKIPVYAELDTDIFRLTKLALSSVFSTIVYLSNNP